MLPIPDSCLFSTLDLTSDLDLLQSQRSVGRFQVIIICLVDANDMLFCIIPLGRILIIQVSQKHAVVNVLVLLQLGHSEKATVCFVIFTRLECVEREFPSFSAVCGVILPATN